MISNHSVMDHWKNTLLLIIIAIASFMYLPLIRPSFADIAQANTATNHVFLSTLLVLSTLAAGWFIVRHRRGQDGSAADDARVVKLAAPPLNRGDVLDTAEDRTALRWLVRIGAAASAVVLTALLVDDPFFVIIAVALTMAAIALLLIVILVPRGL